MKKTMVLLLLALVALVQVFAGGQPEFEVTEGSELIIWADETRASILEELGAQFTETYGVPVTVQQLGFGDIRDNIKVAGPAGEGADIIVGAHDWLGELVASGIVAPIDLGRKADQFTDSSIAAFTYDGALYGMPYAVENLAFVYNPDLVPEVPSDWDEVLALSEEIQSSGAADYGFIRQEGDPYHFFPIQTAYGGYVFGQNSDGTYDAGDVGIDNEGSIASAEWLESAVT
ncbi:MAG: extracellular solute-binding protein, partial [Spirochaetales bacterium]